MTEPEPFIPMKEARVIVPLSESTYYHYAAEGKIPCYRIGSRLLFKASELVEWVESKRITGADNV
jgi:excisionase family DNA binding protein